MAGTDRHIRRWRRFRCTLAALTLSLLSLTGTGCPHRTGPHDGPTPRPEEAAAKDLLEQARGAIAAGDEERGLRLLDATVRRYPATAAADVARLNLGVAALDAGQAGRAERWLLSLRERPPRDPGAAVAWHRAMARVGEALTRPSLARTHLEALIDAGDAGETERVTLAELLLGAAEPGRAWRVLRSTVRSEADPVAGRRRLREILAERSDGDLESLAKVAEPDAPDGGLVRVLLAGRLLAAGELERASEEAARVPAGVLDPPDAETLAELLAEIELRRSVDPGVVGLLLPLSGPFARAGEQARDAVELARATAPEGPRLVVLDTAGTPEGAARAIEELVREHKAIAALGPVGYQESLRAAELAEDYGLPLLPLSSRADLGTGRRWVVRTFASRVAQAQTIARWAVLRHGARRLAVFRAESSYGEEVAAAFREEVERLGGTVVASASYPPAAEDLRGPLRELLGRRIPPLDDLRLDDLGFEALLIADTARGVRRVAPYLHFARVPLRTHPARVGVLLLGAGAWNHPGIVDPAEGLTNNAVFSATFVPTAEDTVVGDFLRSFFARHEVAPTPFQAEAYDTAKLLFSAQSGSGARDRTSLRVALGAVGTWVGVTGVWTVLPDGRVRRTLPVLTIDGDLIRPRRTEEEERELRGTGGAPAF